MTGMEIVVTGAGVALIGGLSWFFFGPKQARRADLRGGVQEVEITVKGGYSPNLIRATEGVPLRLVFDRQENGDCSSRVVFPDFGVSTALAAFGRTTVELMPARVGEFGFACGMNMLHGTLVVEAGNGDGESRAGVSSAPAASSVVSTHTHEATRAVGLGPTQEVRGTTRVEFVAPGRRGGVPDVRDEYRIAARSAAGGRLRRDQLRRRARDGPAPSLANHDPGDAPRHRLGRLPGRGAAGTQLDRSRGRGVDRAAGGDP